MPNNKTFVNPPSRCDICDEPIQDEFIDGVVHGIIWASVCPSCYTATKVSIGKGLGQKYRKSEATGDFVQVSEDT